MSGFYVGGPEAWERLGNSTLLRWPVIPVGPEGVVARILVRSRRQPWWNDMALVRVALASYGRKRKVRK